MLNWSGTRRVSLIRSGAVQLCVAVSLLLLTSIYLRAESEKGTITGRAVDAAGGVLQGAEIRLDPSGSVTKSNRSGEFSINEVAPGAYTLNISFLGLAPYSASVTVTAGQATQVNAVLIVNTEKQEINVTADRPHGEAEAINRQRTADNILQVLPYEVIQSLPNANVADALGRLPSVTLERDEGEGKYVQIRGTEPRYSNVTIDGVNVPSPEAGVRQVKLDVIPSDLVESVEINKTLMANMDGDAIGGSVNLRTKTAGDQPTVSLFGIGGGTPIFKGRGVSQFGATVGQRFGREKRLGLLFGGTYDWNGRGINDIEPGPKTVQCDPGNCGSNVSSSAQSFPTYGGIDLRDYRYDRARYGFTGSVDYKLNDTTDFYVHGLYSHFNNFGDRWVYSPSINSYTTSALQGGSDGSMQSNAQIRRPVQVVGSLETGGRHFFGSSTLTWEFAASRSSTEDNGYSTAYFGPDPNNSSSPIANVQFGLNVNNPYRPKFVVQNGINVYDPSQYYLQSPNIDFSRSYSPQLNLQAGASYSKGYSWGTHLGTFEIGGKFRNEHKFQDSNDVYYAVNGLVPMSSFIGNLTDHGYYDGSYKQGPFVDYSKVTSFFNSNIRGNTGLFTVDPNATHLRNDPNDFNIQERVSAGYVSNIINFGKWRLYTGIRFEGTNLNVLGYNVAQDGDTYLSTAPLRQTSGYFSPLPSAELSYNLTTNSRIRLAYGRGIARPNFGDLPPYFSLDISKQTISTGNPNLNPTRANNYDLLYEHYLNPLGLIQGGFFYKDIRSPIYTVETDVTSGPYANYKQFQPLNGSSAYVWGFEVAYQQHLSFLPGFLSSGGISANYSWTTSQGNGIPGRSDSPALQRQAPNTWNISPTYDRGRVSVRIGISYNGANIFAYQYSDGAALGLKGPNGDNYLYAHTQLDAQASIRLNRGFSAIIYGLNLNNEVFGFYYGSSQYPNQREYYKSTYAAGLRWNSRAGR